MPKTNSIHRHFKCFYFLLNSLLNILRGKLNCWTGFIQVRSFDERIMCYVDCLCFMISRQELTNVKLWIKRFKNYVFLLSWYLLAKIKYQDRCSRAVTHAKAATIDRTNEMDNDETDFSALNCKWFMFKRCVQNYSQRFDFYWWMCTCIWMYTTCFDDEIYSAK